eukprot:gene38907-48043_t
MLGPHEQLTLRQRLRSVAIAISTSQQVGTVHAVYVLAQPQLLVQSSRKHVFLNALVRREIILRPVNIDESELNELEGTDSAIKDSPSTTLGKRDAYHAVVKHLLDKGVQCSFDFYAFASAYTVRKESSTPRGINSKVHEGVTIPITIDEGTGNWGETGEAGLLGQCTTAVERYNQIRALDDQPQTGGFPLYVQKSLKKRIASEELLADSGTPLVDTTDCIDNELDQLVAEHGDDSEPTQFLSRAIMSDTTAAPLPENHGRNACISGVNPAQLVMFLSGEGGT